MPVIIALVITALLGVGIYRYGPMATIRDLENQVEHLESQVEGLEERLTEKAAELRLSRDNAGTPADGKAEEESKQSGALRRMLR